MSPEIIEDINKRNLNKNWKFPLLGECPVGWLGIVEELHKSIVSKYPDYEIFQIKEKFGTLRYYCSVDGYPDVTNLIRMAAMESSHTCQRCGQLAKIRNIGMLIATLCEECYKEKSKS